MSEHLRQATLVRGLIAWTLLAIAAVTIGRAVRHPLRHARYLAARAFRRIPRRVPDGDPLTRDEMRAFLAVVQCWKTTPERTPHP